MEFEATENKDVVLKEQQKTEIIQPVTMETITEYLDSTGLTKQLLPKEKSMFVNMAQMYGLNPFKREIYCNVYGSGDYRQCSIVTGYEVYLKRAERTGKMNGWECEAKGSGDSLEATVTIYRKDWEHPFKHTVYYKECVQKNKSGNPNAIWAKMPSFMTKKVAMAQAFRLCFPDEFGGMPYTNDEIGNEDETEKIKSANSETKTTNQETITPFDKKRMELESIITSYGVELHGEPYNLANQALDKGNEDDVTAMIARTKSYLNKKGINV